MYSFFYCTAAIVLKLCKGASILLNTYDACILKYREYSLPEFNYHEWSVGMHVETLCANASALVANGRGILAADESTPTIGKRFDAIGVTSTEETRREYRSLLFSTPNLSDYISGVILYDETLRQNTLEGPSVPQWLAEHGIMPGIKVDSGAKALAGFDGEKVTEGLDGLRDRLKEYSELGAKFAKWRAVITIGDGMPSKTCIDANAHALARYASLCQEANIVPIVEPEVLMDGNHSVEECYDVTTAALQSVFNELNRFNVLLEGMLLKASMVISGKTCPQQASIEDVAGFTVTLLRQTVPAAVPGIVFLSGGQSDVLATEHLNAMNQMGPHPWALSFSYGRALQAPALNAWAGQSANAGLMQAALFDRAQKNSAAALGEYQGE